MENRAFLLLPFLLAWFITVGIPACSCMSKQRPSSVQFYYHDRILSKNRSTDTSSLVASPLGNLKALGDGLFHFGDVIVFDDPLTEGPSHESKRVGTGQGIYIYTGRTNISAFWAFTAFIDTEEVKGSLSFMGGETILLPTRDIPVVGGTGDFMGALGIATLQTTTFTGVTDFTLSLKATLWYC